MARNITILAWLLGAVLHAQTEAPWSVRMAVTLMDNHRDSIVYNLAEEADWDYEMGLYLKSLEMLWRQTGDGTYFYYIRRQMDRYVREDGSLRTYDEAAYNIDHITPGRVLLMLWQQTGQEKYLLGAAQLRKQLANHPRTHEGGFWHKKRYPWQMWLDGLYMAQPFYAEYSICLGEPQNFDDIANQFVWMEQHARDTHSGLLYHGWDESRQQRWANPATGLSPHFWGRAMGWYAMALVDALDYFPAGHPRRHEIVAILDRLAEAVVKVQDPQSGLWYQVLDRASEPGNYREASASCMFTYALLKGVRMGYLDEGYLIPAKRAYAGILQEFMVQTPDGHWHLDKVCSVAGLGGNPYRDGSLAYYTSEPQRRDDLKGAAPFILASLEMEHLDNPRPGTGKTVLLDRFFNNEYRKGERFHYTWEDITDSGYAWWGASFTRLGAKIASLDEAPTAANLADAEVYILVDPDTPKETAAPHYVYAEHIRAIAEWVKAGGTLVLMANDAANCELEHFNALAGVFGIQFTDQSRNMVKNNQYEQGELWVPAEHAVFRRSRRLFVKEMSLLRVMPPAKPLLTAQGDVVMAMAHYGQGRVFALGDPWLYNEYVDGKRLPAAFDNYTAAEELAAWLLTDEEESNSPFEVEAAVEQLRQVLLSGEADVLDRITAPSLSYGHSDGRVEDKATFIAQLTSGQSNFTEIDLREQSIAVSGGTAVVRHLMRASTHDAGKAPGLINLKVILVWVREEDGWKLLARQAVKM